MKNLKYLTITLILILLIAASSIFAQWDHQQSGTAEHLFDVHVTMSSFGLIIGGNGTVLRTTNGGSQWNSINSGTNSSLKAMDFAGLSNRGWAVGMGGTVLKTSNSGFTWSVLPSFTNENLSDIYVVGSNDPVIYIAGSSGKIHFSTNAGADWVTKYVGAQVTLTSILFLNIHTGWTVGGNKIFKSMNSGLNWSLVQSGTNNYLNSIYFTSAQTGWIVGTSGTILRTTNAGDTWSLRNSGTQNSLLSVTFKNDSTGYIVGENGIILKTTNYGANWINISTPTSNILRSVRFALGQGNTGWAVGINGTIIRTTNGGFPIGVENISNETPESFELEQNYPNPFNPSTKIRFSLNLAGNVKLSVYDILGKEVGVLVNEHLNSGKYEIDFDASKLSSGIYLYKLETGGFVETKRMVLNK